MKIFNQVVISSILSITAFAAQAQVKVTDPWVRATVAQQKATGAFMQLSSPQNTRLIEVHTNAAASAEVHQMEMVDNVMKMREVNGLDLPANKTVELKPGGYHVMLMGLNAQAKVGDVIPLTLVFENKDKKRETVNVNAVVKPLTQTSMPEHQH
ncbi:copper chaperone PCu(A)C [Undibacterium sp. Dicai25W]|uniref:copper chaperone PCu(A)C n=1 Tax=Undibacterium sp. Dicai25W TaxID=3413034 RepID=UPI003BEFC4AE